MQQCTRAPALQNFLQPFLSLNGAPPLQTRTSWASHSGEGASLKRNCLAPPPSAGSKECEHAGPCASTLRPA
eukprot:8690554-Pyramimonas_sp.AAC.1